MRALQKAVAAGSLMVAWGATALAEEPGAGQRRCEISEATARAAVAGTDTADLVAENERIMAQFRLSDDYSALIAEPDYPEPAGVTLGATPVRLVQPRFPLHALESNTNGIVVMVAKVNREGAVERAYVINADPEGVFEDSATAAVLKWTYAPSSDLHEPPYRFVSVVVAFCQHVIPGSPLPVPPSPATQPAN